MSDALAVKAVTPDELDLIKKTVASGATDAELKLYLYDCARQGVHPLDRLLHFTKRGGKYTPVTSIDLMRIRAAETNEYAGSEDAEFVGDQSDPLFSACVSVWRLVQGTRCEFCATARWSEYFPGEQSGHMWKKMPYTMLAKCAEALALRKGFPRQLAGLYASEELDQAERKTEPVRIPSQAELDGAPPKANGENIYMPDGLTDENLPAGVCYLSKVAPGMGKVAAFVWYTGQPPTEEGVPIFKQTTEVREWCAKGVPVRLTFKTSGTSGKSYIGKIEPVPNIHNSELDGPLDEGSVPF